MKKVVAAFARNSVFANILLALIFLSGGIATVSMVREAFPQFSLDVISVLVPYPGADPEEVEEGICRKIEEAVEEVEGIKQVNTTAAESMASAAIEVDEDYDVERVLDQVRSKIDAISTFPADAEKPIVSEVVHREGVLLICLSGDLSDRALKRWAQEIEEEVRRIPVVSQVDITGTRDYEISIELSEQMLREYGLSLLQVADAVRRSNLNLAGGTIRGRGEQIRIRTIGRKYTGEEIASIVVIARPDGEVVTLDRIATIRDDFTEDPVTAAMDGKPAVFLVVFKTPQEDAITISKAIHKYVARKRAEMKPDGAEMTILYDLSAELLRARIRLLVKNGIIGLCLVFLLLWLFLDLRLSFWAGMGMPISLAGAMAILWASGGTINMISLFGLIMVLGIIVDDAIVVGEAIYVHRGSGQSGLRAAVDGVCEVGLPVIAAVTTTIVAFIPLAYVGGIMGKFIRILPLVVVACLSISLVECLILLPAHLNHLPDPHAERKHRGRLRRAGAAFHRRTSKGLEWFVEQVYAPFLRRSLRWSYVSLSAAIAVLLLTAGVMKAGFLKFQVFPKIDGFIITATVEFPAGTPPHVTASAVRQVEQAFDRVAEQTPTDTGEPLVAHRISLVGASMNRTGSFGTHLGSVQLVLLASERRGVHSADLTVAWEDEIGSIPGLESLTFSGMSAGPPGAPIEIWLQGEDIEAILAAAAELKGKLAQYEGVYQIQSDFRPGKQELRLTLKPEARALGLTVSDLAGQVYAGYYGEEAVRLQRGQDDIRVRVRYPVDERRRLSDFRQVRVRARDGREVPLMSVADVELAPGFSSINRTDGMRRVAVSAEVDNAKANANEIFADLGAGFLGGLAAKYPGVHVALQGEAKRMRESFSSLLIGFPLALIGIFVIIATIFRSYVQPLVIMTTVPFGIIGAVLGHILLADKVDHSLSMMSTFGIVALAGVVVNDAIVMIEAINENIARGMPFFEAIVKGGVRRFRAVFLTTISTVGGLTPLIMETDLQARFLIPMALSLASGVAFATLLTLVLVPGLLVILNDMRCLVHRVRFGVWPARHEVEPARLRYIDTLDEPAAEEDAGAERGPRGEAR